jgi:hypothetical protein
VPRSPGVYRIRVLDTNDRPLSLRRLNGDDPGGILHTGETGNLRDRLEKFQAAVPRGAAPHQGGWNFFRYRYVNVFPLECLSADYVVTADKQAARALEKALQEDYWLRFLDFPPLDGQV